MKTKKNYFLFAFATLFLQISAMEKKPIVISTDNTALVYTVGEDNRLYQNYYGRKLINDSDYIKIGPISEAIITHGMEDYYEPAVYISHPDGNLSTLLTYTHHSLQVLADGSQQTVITTCDPVYKNEVKIFFTAFPHEDIIKSHIEITSRENHPVEILKYASSMLHFCNHDYYLTQFNGDWASEANATETKLEYGRKQLDSKLGTRASMFCSPFFQLSLDAPAQEDAGTLVAGTIAWTGNYRFTFEVDHKGELRVISGINPEASSRTLTKGETLVTPEFIFTFSNEGKGKASRNFHNWARKYQIYKGLEDRMTLLNNWEATYFDFNEEKLKTLIDDAADLGVDMFLLDDGWFGNKYPRSSDTQGLGDWTETKNKLPNGIGALTGHAKEKGVKFGLWIEPEMVNPKSELYEKHKEWVITLPNREEYYFRNQLVLDLSNPEVQEYVFNVVDGLMTKYPEISFFKWDCNSPITNIFSNYEKMNQSHLYVDYVNGLYRVLKKINCKYPDLMMMMCSGGGGRSDYEGLKYFTEFWPSDNTDPIERLYIQWGFSQIFPSKAICSHVTTWNKNASIKFKTNVAMMGKLGFDLKLEDLSDEEINYCKNAIRVYNSLKNIILEGDQYRLVSPYKSDHTSTQYVNKNKTQSVLFTFDINPRFKQNIFKADAVVRCKGLEPSEEYNVVEIDRMIGDDLVIGKYSGEYLMEIGLPLFTLSHLNSRVFLIEKI